MSDYGLRVWDANGNLEIDISTRLTRLIVIVTYITPARQATWLSYYGWIYWADTIVYTTIYVSGMQNNGEWFFTGIPQHVSVTISNGYFVLGIPNYADRGTYQIRVMKL